MFWIPKTEILVMVIPRYDYSAKKTNKQTTKKTKQKSKPQSPPPILEIVRKSTEQRKWPTWPEMKRRETECQAGVTFSMGQSLEEIGV